MLDDSLLIVESERLRQRKRKAGGSRTDRTEQDEPRVRSVGQDRLILGKADDRQWLARRSVARRVLDADADVGEERLARRRRAREDEQRKPDADGKGLRHSGKLHRVPTVLNS